MEESQKRTRSRSSVELRNFSMTIDSVPVLRDVNLFLEAGQLTVIYGPRGAGKSVLLRSFSGLNREIYENVSWSGELLINEKPVQVYDKKLLRQMVSYVEPSFVEAMDDLTFADFIKITLSESSVSLDDFASELDRLGILKFLRRELKTPVRQFYTMEKIMLLLFAAIVKKSMIVVLDCILDHLDDDTLVPVLKELLNIKQDRIVVLSTRQKLRFLPIADQFVMMKSGTIEYRGPAREFVLER
ncbi:ATP-binding cassette domain-containing protein [Thermotoga caldifontis]|uniref:ATP-binding cassette domain-containing protein n=1 Tax=Thermotoga caldifontis TaxID=1508419 RepID=UPI0005971E38|nr:ABC transporter ATP-binding protein [Thermotoga caldifontis]